MALKTWNPAGHGNWADTGNWTGGIPVSGDDVNMGTSGYNCTVSGTIPNLNSLTMANWTGILAGSVVVNIPIIGTALTTTAVVFNNYQHTFAGTFSLNPVATATINLTWGDKLLNCYLVMNGPGTVICTTGILALQSLVHWAGTLKLDGATDNAGLSHVLGPFNSSNTNTRTLDFGNSNLLAASVTLTDTTNLTLSQGSLGIITAAGFYCAVTAGNTTQTLSGSLIMGAGTLSAKLTISTFKALGPASKNTLLKVISGSQLKVTNTFVVSGNSAINRLYFGQDYTTTLSALSYPTVDLTGATVSGNGFDVGGIAFISPTPLDFSAVSNYSGDCGGNTITGGGTLTFTPSSIQTLNISGTDFTAASTTIFSTGAWTSRMPLPQDRTVISTTGSGVVNRDITRIGNLSLSGGVTDLTGSSVSLFGSMDWTNHRLFPSSSLDALSIGYVNLTPGAIFPITCGGVRIGSTHRFIAPSGAIFQLRDKYWGPSFDADEQGTLDAATYNVDVLIRRFNAPYGPIKMGNGTWTTVGGSNNTFSGTYPVECGNSTLKICNNISADRTLAWGDGSNWYLDSSVRNTLNNIALYVNNITIGATTNCNLTFKNLVLDAAAPSDSTVNIANGSVSPLTFTGTISGLSLDKRIILKASVAGTPANVVKGGTGITTLEFVELQDIAFTPGGVVNIAENCYVGTKVTGCMIPAKGMRFGD